jgi:DNA-binding CsgD family transcriptional regulator
MEQIESLSRREKEVIPLLLQGKSNKQIALSLGVTERTVEFHLKNIYGKWQVNSKIELILKLGKVTGDNIENLGKSTGDFVDENVDNGKQPVLQNRSAQSLKHAISTITKEFAMTKTVLLEDAGNFLRRHPLLWVLPLFLVVSLTIRYLIIDFGLYSWSSYVLLGLFLGAGSLYFGRSWSKIMGGEISFRPLPIVLAAMSPVFVAVSDRILQYTIATILGEVSTTIAGISNEAGWVILPEGKSYFYETRTLTNIDDNFWLFATTCIVLLFFIGFLSNWRLKRKDLEAV